MRNYPLCPIVVSPLSNRAIEKFKWFLESRNTEKTVHKQQQDTMSRKTKNDHDDDDEFMISQRDKRQSQLKNTSGSQDEEIDPNDILRILITTDNHLGYMERDRLRRNDSFITMEEILTVAKDQKVDFILHGGDLFHENKPSRETLHRTIELFRRFCCGDDPVPLMIHSDQQVNFKNK